jgi:hypothetical protein
MWKTEREVEEITRVVVNVETSLEVVEWSDVGVKRIEKFRRVESRKDASLRLRVETQYIMRS